MATNSDNCRPAALLVRTAGTNCDLELAHAFRLAGAEATLVHLDALIANPRQIDRFQIIAFPGGFSYGDDIAAGRILALKLRTSLYKYLVAAIERGTPVIGICNGFQVLVQSGLLPGPALGQPWPGKPAPPTVALTDNACGHFVDDWITIRCDSKSRCIWTQGLDGADEQMILPIAHGEGRFLPVDLETLAQLDEAGCVAMRYVDNPNGSADDVAGICDASGLVFGLMPHPERFVDHTQHPHWTRLAAGGTADGSESLGLRILRRAVDCASRQLTKT